MRTLIAPFFNFIVFIGFLIYKLKKPAVEFVKNRHSNINNAVIEISSQLRSAREKFEEFSGKLKAIDAETISIKEQSKQEANALRVRIVNDSKKIATQIIADSRQASEVMLQDLKQNLIRDLGVRVVDRAEVMIKERLTQVEQQRIRQEFSSQLGDLK